MIEGISVVIHDEVKSIITNGIVVLNHLQERDSMLIIHPNFSRRSISASSVIEVSLSV